MIIFGTTCHIISELEKDQEKVILVTPFILSSAVASLGIITLLVSLAVALIKVN